jgi:hypothetical protein
MIEFNNIYYGSLYDEHDAIIGKMIDRDFHFVIPLEMSSTNKLHIIVLRVDINRKLTYAKSHFTKRRFVKVDEIK